MGTPTTIVLNRTMDPLHTFAFTSNAPITPGMAVEVLQTGICQPMSEAASLLDTLIAVEDDNTAGDLDTVYPAGALVKVYAPQPGDHLYIFIEENVNTVANVTNLITDATADGSFDAAAAQTGKELKLTALDDVTAAGSGGSVRIRARVKS